VAGALGISPERLVELVREAQEKASLPTEVSDDDAG
jgi:hypothetical protein